MTEMVTISGSVAQRHELAPLEAINWNAVTAQQSKRGQEFHIAPLRERNDSGVERNEANAPTAREREQMRICHLAVTDHGWNVVVNE